MHKHALLAAAVFFAAALHVPARAADRDVAYIPEAGLEVAASATLIDGRVTVVVDDPLTGLVRVEMPLPVLLLKSSPDVSSDERPLHPVAVIDDGRLIVTIEEPVMMQMTLPLPGVPVSDDF